MDRRDFIIKGCTACLSATALAGVLSSCSPTQYVTGKLNDDGIWVEASDFKTRKGGKEAWRSFIIVKHESLQYPICLYRFSDQEYAALWMQCTHQGTELQVSGDYLQCPSHGSEFSNKGKMVNGPADRDLRSFPVSLTGTRVFIDLRKK